MVGLAGQDEGLTRRERMRQDLNNFGKGLPEARCNNGLWVCLVSVVVLVYI